MSQSLLDEAAGLFKQHEFDGALKKFEQSASDPASRTAALYGMGCCYSYKFDIYNAKDCFEKVVAFSPASPEAEVARAFIEDSHQWIAGDIDFFSLSAEMRKASPGSLCAYHEEEKTPAVYVCFSCEKPVCLQCTFPVAAKYYCVECGRKKEIEERKRSPLPGKKGNGEPEPVKTNTAPGIKKTALHLGIYGALLCASLLYRFVLRDAAAKNSGIVFQSVSGERVREKGDPTKPGSGDARSFYRLKVVIKNSGSRTLGHIRFRVKLYDTFGQKIAQRDVDADAVFKNPPFIIPPGQSRAAAVKFKNLRGNVAVKRIRLLSFRVLEE